MASKTDPKEDLRNTAIRLRQTVEGIAEATRQRSDAVAAGELDLVKRHDRRIADLNSDLRALKERRVILAKAAAEADLAARTAARDAAIGTGIAPKLEAVIAAIGQFERQLAECAASYAGIKQAFSSYTTAWPASVPTAQNQEFTLASLHALMRQALQHTGRQGDFELVMRRFGDELPSVALRRQADAFLAELRAAELPVKKPAADSEEA